MRTIDLTGKVALITGGGAGIGAGVARALAESGCSVVLAEIDEQRAAETVAEIRAAGGQALSIPTNAMDTEQIERAFQTTDREFGRLDIVVNNVGGVRGARFLDQNERSWRRHIDINLTSMLAATWHGAHAMIRGGRGGSIVNVTSIEGSRAAPMYSVYAACKAGMISFTRSMAVELGEHDIRVNAIAPDLTRTPGLSGLIAGRSDPQEMQQAMQEKADEGRAGNERYIPLRREGKPDECGDLVAFLCSPLAQYITGAIVPIDGGTWASSGWLRTPDGAWGLFG
jgi:NAD(P)-dependent dehydrogenase (short-subunit alcohol dehydrogenase family)